MSLNCPKDSFYPMCEICRPNDEDTCPLFSIRVDSEYKLGKVNLLAIKVNAYATDVDSKKLDEVGMIQTRPLTNKPFKIEPIGGQGKC